jgi:anti-sigma regulatory factor (Ser/Thr protein kinase)
MCHRSRRTYSGDPNTPNDARHFCVAQLESAFSGASDAQTLVEDLELVVSELVTNAVEAGPTDVQLALDIHRDHVRLAVTDSAPGVARQRSPGPESESGRGLLIVDRLARSWGVDYLDRGKRVWAELAVPRSLVLGVNCSR